MKARYTDGKTLRASLSPADAAKADSVLRQYGLMLDQVGAFKPWFVSLLLTQLVVQKANFQPQYGVDMQLHTRAKADAKPEKSLETVDFQLNLFDSIDPADQVKMLLTAKGPEESATQLKMIKDFWLAGDAMHLDSLMNSENDAPGARALILTDRNARWVPQIEQMLKGKDDVLVVVGAAHLVGKQGVVELLKAKGYTVEQL